MIELRNVTKQWPGFALRGVSLRVEKGEYFVLLGPTGSGKTLLLETTAGHHRPDEGQVHLHGDEVTHLPPERRQVGFLYQDCWLFPNLSVAENIAFGLRFGRRAKDERQQRVAALVDMLHIHDLLPRSPVNLSGGERRKVALARALAPEPSVLLLDEPLATLDRVSKERVGSEIRGLHERTHMTTLHVTHDQDVARLLADRVGIIRDGEIVQVGASADVFGQPQSEFVARFVGAPNCFEAIVMRDEGGRAVADVCGVRLRVGADAEGPRMIHVPPTAVRLTPAASGDEDANQFQATICEVRGGGEFVHVRLDVQGLRVEAHLSHQDFHALGANLSSRVCVSFDAAAVDVFPRCED